MGLIMHFYQDIPLKKILEETSLSVDDIDSNQAIVTHISGASCCIFKKNGIAYQAKVGSGNHKLIFQEFAKAGWLFMSEYALAEFVHGYKYPTLVDWVRYTNSVWEFRY